MKSTMIAFWMVLTICLLTPQPTEGGIMCLKPACEIKCMTINCATGYCTPSTAPITKQKCKCVRCANGSILKG